MTRTRNAVPVADITAAVGSVFAALAAALVAIYVSSPAARPWLSDPNGLVALFTSVACAAAALLGLWAAHRAVTDSRFRFVIPSLALWGLLDRAHYGLALMPGDMPMASLGDLGATVARWAIPLGIGTGLGAALVVAVFLGGFAAHRAVRHWAEGRTMITEARVVDLIATAATLILLAPVIGLFGSGDAIGFAVQLIGLAGGATLVLAALASGDHRRTVAGWRRRMRPWMLEAQRPPDPLSRR